MPEKKTLNSLYSISKRKKNSHSARRLENEIKWSLSLPHSYHRKPVPVGNRELGDARGIEGGHDTVVRGQCGRPPTVVPCLWSCVDYVSQTEDGDAPQTRPDCRLRARCGPFEQRPLWPIGAAGVPM